MSTMLMMGGVVKLRVKYSNVVSNVVPAHYMRVILKETSVFSESLGLRYRLTCLSLENIAILAPRLAQLEELVAQVLGLGPHAYDPGSNPACDIYRVLSLLSPTFNTITSIKALVAQKML